MPFALTCFVAYLELYVGSRDNLVWAFGDFGRFLSSFGHFQLTAWQRNQTFSRSDSKRSRSSGRWRNSANTYGKPPHISYEPLFFWSWSFVLMFLRFVIVYCSLIIIWCGFVIMRWDCVIMWWNFVFMWRSLMVTCSVSIMMCWGLLWTCQVYILCDEVLLWHVEFLR